MGSTEMNHCDHHTNTMKHQSWAGGGLFLLLCCVWGPLFLSLLFGPFHAQGVCSRLSQPPFL
jgi:hypothetical protein